MREARLTAICYAGDGINTFELTPFDGQPCHHLGPGTHVDLEIQEGLTRQYSLVELRDDAYVIAVQRERSSRGGSTYLHDRARVGERFRIGTPRNLFALDDHAQHSVLISGGIGIAPMLPMVTHLAALDASWELHFAWRSGPIPFERELLRHAGHVAMAVRDAPGYRRLEIEAIVANAPAASIFYCCGPEAMLAAFQVATNSLPEERRRVEHFSAAEPAAVEGGYVVSLARSGMEFAITPGQTILEALLDRGIDAPHSCQQGICGACETVVLAGIPDHRDGILSDGERAAGKTMLICCSGCKSPRMVLDR